MALPMHILPTILVKIVNLNDPAMKMFFGFYDNFECVGILGLVVLFSTDSCFVNLSKHNT